jgi:hypothetical protein
VSCPRNTRYFAEKPRACAEQKDFLFDLVASVRNFFLVEFGSENHARGR